MVLTKFGTHYDNSDYAGTFNFSEGYRKGAIVQEELNK